MEARTLQAFLRVLYTVNSNPQYILAKSSSQVPAITCTEATAQSAIYARTPLKACLTAVCDSSPELLQDPTRDFSLYVLDPLEAQPLPTSIAHAPHDTSSPRGVAVALGLMSWALESNDSTNVFVTGTIIPHASPALEVVFALRETKRMPKPIFHSYPSFGSISVPGPSQLPNSPYPPQASGMSWLSASQEQRTLTRSADFPELYIGPPRRARGRPEGSTSSKSKVTPQARTSSLPGTSSSGVVETQSESKEEVGRRSKQKTKSRLPRALPTYSPFICTPLTRHTATDMPEGATGVPAFYQHSHPFSQNQTQPHAQLHPQAQPYFFPTHHPLLGLLSAIPSSSSGNAATNATPEQQAALLSALQGLLATNPHLLQLAASGVGLSASNEEQTTEEKSMHTGSSAGNGDEHDDGDSDIVILDSSAIDTTAFCKPSTWQLAASDHDTSPLKTDQESPMPSTQGADSSPLPASTPPSGQENAPTSSQTSTPTVIPEAETPTSKRPTERGIVTASHALDMPATPTPCRTRKRKLGEYIQGQAHPSTPMSSPSPSPSPSVTRTFSSGRALTARPVQSSPTGETKSVPLVRLSSMLGSMRAVATSGSRLQASSSGSSTHGYPASSGTHKTRNQSIAVVSGPSKSKTDHPMTTDASLGGIASDTTSLKRRRTLNEFMAEHEARKNAKVRKRSSSGRKLEADVSANASQAAPSRSAKLVSTRHSHSSPSRSLFRSDSVASSLRPSTRQPALVPGAGVCNPALSSTTSSVCTAPSVFTSTVAPTKNPLKNFVLPAWARTSTAMLPRLSEEVLARQRAEQEAKKAQVSLRRREAAKAKRSRVHGAERSCKESSDEDDEAIVNDAQLRILHPSSSIARSVPSLLPPLPSLPVFASDAVEPPIPSSPPQLHRQLAPAVPSTPPRKPPSSGSAPHCTPSKSGSCSLFTPSAQDPGSLFSPSTPSLTRSLTQVTFTPRSPTVHHHHSGVRRSPWKSMPQTSWTPKRNSGNHQTPRSSRTGRNQQFMSPSLAIRTPQTQTGMGTRAFLLPPPSPCAQRTLHLQKQVHSKMPGGSTPIVPEDSGTIKQESPSDKQNVEPDKGFKEEDRLSCEPDDVLCGEDTPIPPAQCSPDRPTVDDGQGTGELRDITSNDDASQAEEYASSPLPPSSPPSASAFSTPAKHHDSDFNTPTINNLVMPDSDILLPSASDSDGPRGAVDTATWLADDTCTASWLTDSEASAWLTETEAWLTDTEGGPLLTDSDAAWLSDSDAVFGDMSSLPTSSASNWLSDDADVDTDGELGAMEGRDGEFDAGAIESVFAALVARGGQRAADKEEAGVRDATHATRVVESEFWASMPPPLWGANAIDEVGAAAPGDAGEPVDEDKVAQDIQALLDGLVGT